MTIPEAKGKLVALAKAQVGYREGPDNYNKYADDPKIVQLYGWCPQNQPWCGTFVNWVFLNAFGYDIGSRLTYGGSAACSAAAQYFKNHGAFVHMPNVGDQAFFNVNGGINHTGIVVSVTGSDFVTVEGNYSDKVSEVHHNIGLPDVAGFGRPCWAIVEGADASMGEDSSDVPVPQSRQVLKKGMTGDDVKALQEKLIASGYPVGTSGADGDFGRNTYNAVIAFQKDHGLTADGEAGPLTMAALDEALAEEPNEPDPPDDVSPPDEPAEEKPGVTLPELTYGSKGEAVVLLQAALNLKGYNCGTADGHFGAKTLAAVNKFLEDEGLFDYDKGPDGIVDQSVWKHVLDFFE